MLLADRSPCAELARAQRVAKEEAQEEFKSTQSVIRKAVGDDKAKHSGPSEVKNIVEMTAAAPKVAYNLHVEGGGDALGAPAAAGTVRASQDSKKGLPEEWDNYDYEQEDYCDGEGGHCRSYHHKEGSECRDEREAVAGRVLQ